MKKIMFAIFLLLLSYYSVYAQSWSFFGYGNDEEDLSADEKIIEKQIYNDYIEYMDYIHDKEVEDHYKNIDIYDTPSDYLYVDNTVSWEWKRYQPSDNIGLFLDNDLFVNAFYAYLNDLNFTANHQADGIIRVKNKSTGSLVNVCLNMLNNEKIYSVDIVEHLGSSTIQDMGSVLLAFIYSSGFPNNIIEADNIFLDYANKVNSYSTPSPRNVPIFKTNYFTINYGINNKGEHFYSIIAPEKNFFSSSLNCDSNYEGACIPKTNGNLDCNDLNGMRNFFVVGNDIHYFDGNKNGVCCEPYPQHEDLSILY